MAVLLSSLILVLLVLAGRSAAKFAPPLIVFGDSTVDTGNNNYINTTLDFSVNSLPYGHEHFGKPSGRFSNGRIFLDFICETAGLPYVSPYLQPDADFSQGANFASSGSGVLTETNEGLVIPLDNQLQYFTEFQEAVHEKWREYFSDAIYIISIANNDYMSGYFSVPKLREQYTPQEFVALIVSKVIGTCEFLYSKGARKLLVFGVAPLGCLPALRLFHPTQGCFQPAGDLGVAHNTMLGLAIKEWQSNHRNAALVEAGLHDFMLERINDPAAFGFTEGVSACCGSGTLRGEGHCGRPNPNTGEDSETCDDSEGHVFWDSYHGSERLHRDFAKALWDGSLKVSSPLTLRQLFEVSSPSACNEGNVETTYGTKTLDVHIEHSSF